MKDKMKMLVILMLLVSLVIVGCTPEAPINEKPAVVEENSNEEFPRELVDGLGNLLAIEKLPERIISAAPSHTEILFALGLENNIIAVSGFCDYPAAALDKEKIGGYQSLNTEKIIELSPDMVFIYGEGDEDVVKLLEAAGIIVVRFEPESIEEVFETIIAFGEITATENKAQEILQDLVERRDTVVEKVKNQQPVRAFYEIWHDPIMTAGPGSFMDELISLAGGENIAGDAEGAYPIFSLEALVERDPEVYLIPASHDVDFYTMTEEQKNERIHEIISRTGYGTLTAVKENRIQLLEPNIVSRPGNRIIDALELVAKALYPELF